MEDGLYINGVWFFWPSLSLMLLYRIVSACLVYEYSGKWYDFILQFLDVYIYVIIFKSIKGDFMEPTMPQLLISTTEATFESSGQVIIQGLILLIDWRGRGYENVSVLILISFITGAISIATRVNKDDYKSFTEESGFRDSEFKMKFKIECNQNHSGKYRFCCFNLKYILRIIWRCFGMLGRMMQLIGFVWVVNVWARTAV